MGSTPRPVYYPAMLDLAGRAALLVGGGEVANQKAGPLIEAGATLRVVAPELVPALRARIDAGEATWEQRPVAPGDTEGCAVVVCATNNREVNKQVSEEARRAGIPVNVVDDPELCTFIVPATVRRGPLQVAVSTGGRSPAFAKFMRKELEQTVGEEYGVLAAMAGRMRDLARDAGIGYQQRDEAAAQVLPELLALLRAGREADAWALAEQRATAAPASTGTDLRTA
jgi:precorrin-2 dehydrogenase/sirohydrochlorin ferrochelatase